jgi:hypothetical protein
MKILQNLKTLFRSRSLDFTLHSNRAGNGVRSLKTSGIRVHYRPAAATWKTSTRSC